MKPKRPLFRKPLTSDWTFWLFVVFVVLGTLRGLYASGQNSSDSDFLFALTTTSIDIAFTLAGGFLIFALVPAAIRKVVQTPRDRKALATPPEDLSTGWKQDPLKLHDLRWWDGSHWTGAIEDEKPGERNYAIWIFVLLAVMSVAVFFLGRATSDGSQNASALAGPAFNDLAAGLIDYHGIQVDMNDPFLSLGATKDSFDQIETNYVLLNGALAEITAQEELGPGAPALGDLETFVTSLGPWIEVRKNYYASLQECGPIDISREPTDCDARVFDEFEKPMVDTITPVAEAWEAVVASTPKTDS